MYILTFKRSRSKYFEKGLNLAERLGGTWDGETMVLKIPESKLMKAYDRLMSLFGVVGRWSSLRATFKGRDVDPYRFILNMHFIMDCARERSFNPDHCWLYADEQGWGCRMINNILYLLLGDGKYAWNEKYWYNFGGFDEKNEWIIDKDIVYQRLIEYAEGEGLDVCSYFNAEWVRKAVDKLPSRIVPDDKEFRIYYEEEYFKGERIKVPVNIRHIPDPPDKYDFQPRKYDVDAIIPIDHSLAKKPKKPPGGRFWKRFSKN